MTARALLPLAALLLLAGCSSTSVVVDPQPGFDASAYRTYTFIPAKALGERNPLERDLYTRPKAMGNANARLREHAATRASCTFMGKWSLRSSFR